MRPAWRCLSLLVGSHRPTFSPGRHRAKSSAPSSPPPRRGKWATASPVLCASARELIPAPICAAQGGEGFEDLGYVLGFGAGELGRQVRRRDGAGGGVQCGFHGLHPLDQRFAPGGLGLADGFGLGRFSGLGFRQGEFALFGPYRGRAGLVFRAQPVDDAALFLGGALGVEGDEAFEGFGVGQRGGPTIPLRPSADV